MAALTLVVPRALATPNADRGAHWSTRHKLTKVWELELWAALHACPGWRDWLLPKGAPPERRRVTITRRHRSARSFCKDSDNRMFAGKGIRDCLKRLHLLVDDSDTWLESTVVDVTHPDKRSDTIICLERIP
jgi:hypothetical protein